MRNFPHVSIAPNENLDHAVQRVRNAHDVAGIGLTELGDPGAYGENVRALEARTDRGLYVCLISTQVLTEDEEYRRFMACHTLCAGAPDALIVFNTYTPEPISKQLTYCLADPVRFRFYVALVKLMQSVQKITPEEASRISEATLKAGMDCYPSVLAVNVSELSHAIEDLVVIHLRTEKNPDQPDTGFFPQPLLAALGCLFGESIRRAISANERLDARWFTTDDGRPMMHFFTEVKKGFFSKAKEHTLALADPISRVYELYQHGMACSLVALETNAVEYCRQQVTNPEALQ